MVPKRARENESDPTEITLAMRPAMRSQKRSAKRAATSSRRGRSQSPARSEGSSVATVRPQATRDSRVEAPSAQPKTSQEAIESFLRRAKESVEEDEDDDEERDDATTDGGFSMFAEDPKDGIAFSHKTNDAVVSTTYRGEVCIFNRRHKSIRLMEIKANTGMWVENFIDDDLKPRKEEDGTFKKELDWSLPLLNAIADLTTVCADKDKVNTALWAQLRARMEREGHAGLTQTRTKEVRAVEKKMLSGRIARYVSANSSGPGTA